MSNIDSSLNGAHISNNIRDFEAARSSFFVLTIPKEQLANLYSPDFSGDEATASESDKIDAGAAFDALRLSVVKSSVPNFSLNKLEYRRGNDVVKFAGVPDFKDGSITVDDIVGLDTKSILYAWYYKGYNPLTRKGGKMSEYKKTCNLIEYTQDYEIIRTWTLDGCFILDLTESDFDKENDSKRQINISLSFDRAIMQL